MVIRSIRRLAGRALRAVLPGRWVRALAKPALVPGFYRRGVLEVERQRDQLARREGLDDDYWAALLRKHAHILDKALQRCDYEPGHSKDYYGEAVEALAHIERPETLNDESVLWAKKLSKSFYESIQIFIIAKTIACRGKKIEQILTCGLTKTKRFISTLKPTAGRIIIQ